MGKRYVLEGEWRGYSSQQDHVVHREVISQRRALAFEVLHAIIFPDGTALLVRVREAKPREKIEEKRGYAELIRDAERYGGGKSTVTVDEITKVRNGIRDGIAKIAAPTTAPLAKGSA